MSLAIVNLLKLIDSGAIHLIGSLPFDAKTRGEEPINRVQLCTCVSQKMSPHLGIIFRNNTTLYTEARQSAIIPCHTAEFSELL